MQQWQSAWHFFPMGQGAQRVQQGSATLAAPLVSPLDSGVSAGGGFQRPHQGEGEQVQKARRRRVAQAQEVSRRVREDICMLPHERARTCISITHRALINSQHQVEKQETLEEDRTHETEGRVSCIPDSPPLTHPLLPCVAPFGVKGRAQTRLEKLVPTLTRTSRSVKHHTAMNCKSFHVQIVSIFHMFILIALKKAVKSRPVHSNSNKNDKHLLASLCARL